MFIDRLGYYRDRFGLVHRQIANEWWTRHFGVSLPQNIVVHHINGNRLDREYNRTYRLSHIDHIRELKRNWERKHRRELKARGAKV